DGTPRTVRLEAPPPAATARGAVGPGEREVPGFAGQPVAAAVHLSAEDDASADPRAHGYVHHVAAPLAGSEMVLAEGAGVAVVVHEARKAGRFGDRLREVDAVPARHVHGPDHPLPLKVDHPAETD